MFDPDNPFHTSGRGVALVVTLFQARDNWSTRILPYYVSLFTYRCSSTTIQAAPDSIEFVSYSPFGTLSLMDATTTNSLCVDAMDSFFTLGYFLLRKPPVSTNFSTERSLVFAWLSHWTLRPNRRALVCGTFWCSTHPSLPRTFRSCSFAEGHIAVLTRRGATFHHL